MLGDEIADGLHEEFLLWPAQVNSELLKSNQDRVIRIEVSAHMQLGDPAWPCLWRRLLAFLLRGPGFWIFLRGSLFQGRGKKGFPSHAGAPPTAAHRQVCTSSIVQKPRFSVVSLPCQGARPPDSQVGVSKACPFDLHALVPVPFEILRLGPDDPRAPAWLWEHWGTTWSLRQVEEAPRAGIEAALPDTHAAFRCRFWAADWTPWPALGAVRRRWPALRIAVQPSYGLEETEAAGARPRRAAAAAGAGRAASLPPNGVLLDGSPPCHAENSGP